MVIRREGGVVIRGEGWLLEREEGVVIREGGY